MTKSCLKHYLTIFALALLSLVFWIGVISYAVAQTYWIQAPEKYYKYDTTPTRTTKVYKYITTTDIETARPTWVKLNGVYVKYTTIGGGVKYTEEVIVVQPVPIEPVCPAFKCVDDYGVTYDMSKQSVMKCPMVQIKKGVAVEYDGAQAGIDKCR